MLHPIRRNCLFLTRVPHIYFHLLLRYFQFCCAVCVFILLRVGQGEIYYERKVTFFFFSFLVTRVAFSLPSYLLKRTLSLAHLKIVMPTCCAVFFLLSKCSIIMSYKFLFCAHLIKWKCVFSAFSFLHSKRPCEKRRKNEISGLFLFRQARRDIRKWWWNWSVRK